MHAALAGACIHQPSRKKMENQVEAEITSRFSSWRNRNKPGPALDERVNIIFYFLAPHRFKPVDVEFMMRLSQRCLVVLIMAKVDTMAIVERAEYQNMVAQDMKTAGIVHPKDSSEFKMNSACFAVIGQNRSYPWGDDGMLNRQHCDLALFRSSWSCKNCSRVSKIF